MLARSPNRKRAEQYLAASGAVPITIIERDGACSISTASKLPTMGNSASTWWTAAADAPRVASAARTLAGPAPDLSTATAALARSAASLRAVLTADDVAIGRASAAVVRLDAMIEQMRRDGTLREFNARFKRGRAAALAEGRGFMNYAAATARLKRALIPHLIGRDTAPMRSLFEQIFR
jgi:hypothetical protein